MSVLLEPVPAMTGTLLLVTRTTVSTTRRSSASLIAGVSPVVPQGTRPLTPCWIWNSTIPSSASTSTSPFLKGVTRAVKVPLNISLLQFEVSVQDLYPLFYPFGGQHARDLDLRGGDHPNRDASPPKRSEHTSSVTRPVQHTGPDDRDLAQPLLTLDLPAQRVGNLACEPPRLRVIRAPHGKGHVRRSPRGTALDDDVDRDAPFGQGREDATQGPWPGADHTRDVKIVDDTGQSFAGLHVFQALSSRYHGARTLVEGGADVYLDPV